MCFSFPVWEINHLVVRLTKIEEGDKREPTKNKAGWRSTNLELQCVRSTMILKREFLSESMDSIELLQDMWSQYSSVDLPGRPGFDSRQGQEIFLFSTASRPTLGPTQLPIQWVQCVKLTTESSTIVSLRVYLLNSLFLLKQPHSLRPV
jgi:hypothetical protein